MVKNFNFIYKTINLINNRFYIGMHSTNNINDGYLGSGNRLNNEIRKYGKDNFKIEILEFCQNRDELIKREKEIVTISLLNEELCLNLTPGGLGGFNPNSITKEARQKCSNTMKIRGTCNGWKNVSASACKNGKLFTLGMLGKKHSKETKEKLSKTKIGKNNNQFGKRKFINPQNINEYLITKDKPTGFISKKEFNELKKNKKNSAYGKSWYNDGNTNFLLNIEDDRVLLLNKGRIGKLFARITA